MEYPALFEEGEGGFIVVTFRDIPEAITQGRGFQDALEMAEDSLITALEFYIEREEGFPEPSEKESEEVLIRVHPSVLNQLEGKRLMRLVVNEYKNSSSFSSVDRFVYLVNQLGLVEYIVKGVPLNEAILLAYEENKRYCQKLLSCVNLEALSHPDFFVYPDLYEVVVNEEDDFGWQLVLYLPPFKTYLKASGAKLLNGERAWLFTNLVTAEKKVKVQYYYE